jgi:hypothetical protein
LTSGLSAPAGWRAHPAYFLVCISPILSSYTRVSMPVTETGLAVVIDDLYLAVRAEATPTGSDSWSVTVWTAAVERDGDITTLALAVARAGLPAELSVTVTRADVEAEIDEPDAPTPAGYQRALWRVFRKAMSQARAQADTAGLRARIPGLHVVSLGGSHPFQADGTWHGYPFYFRFRYGTARLDVGRPATGGVPLWTAETDFEGYWGAGDLTIEEFTTLFCQLGASLSRHQDADLSAFPDPAPVFTVHPAV